MRVSKIINAKEARKMSLNTNQSSLNLMNETIIKMYAEINSTIHAAVNSGKFKTCISLAAINELNDVNEKAAQLSVEILRNRLNELGYKFDPFTNYTSFVHLSWY